MFSIPPSFDAPRVRVLARFIFLMVLLGAITRLGLAIFNGDAAALSPLTALTIFGLGLLYDIAASLWWALPLALLLWLWPAEPRAHKGLRWAVLALVLALVVALVNVASSEFVFWNEFASRFNFIAVDYLIYSREVLGNIRESYNMPLLLGGTGLVALIVMVVFTRSALAWPPFTPSRFLARGLAFVGYVAIASAVTALVDTRWKESLNQPQLAQLAGNGTWEFFHAFRFNQIDFAQYYQTMPQAKAEAIVKNSWASYPHYKLTGSPTMPIERDVTPAGAVRDVNVVLVSIESFGAEFIASLGGKPGLTPFFEALGTEGIRFTKLYATGTRTVRGLEALALSVPPTPGHAIPMRPQHKGLFTLGGLLKTKGYDPVYLYGGYSYFDNMDSFFGGNGYTVFDRTGIKKENITHENIWGVADEDLFNQALTQIDERVAKGKRVFAHVMTTSNHRPFTYPEGRVDIRSGTGRDGAVKYTDYAIGKFVADAKKKPWFDNTIFIFVADHTSIARGRSDLPLAKYHIPMVIYAPKFIAPQTVDAFSSLMDVAPTIMGLLNTPYTSQFFGHDILRDFAPECKCEGAAFLANYQTVGYIKDGITVELKPKRGVRAYATDTGVTAEAADAKAAIDTAIAHYQVAARHFSDASVRARGHVKP